MLINLSCNVVLDDVCFPQAGRQPLQLMIGSFKQCTLAFSSQIIVLYQVNHK